MTWCPRSMRRSRSEPPRGEDIASAIAELGHGKEVSVTRLCIVEQERAGILADVTNCISARGLNIVGNNWKLRNELVFQVVDFETESVATAQQAEVVSCCLIVSSYILKLTGGFS